MRAGEISSLDIGYVDFERRLALLKETKNGSARIILLPTKAIRVLKGLIEADHDNKAIFDLKSDSLDVSFRKIRGRCGFDDLHFHDLRRETLTRLAKKFGLCT